ncbi:MAG: PIN domain nuclease [Nitrospirota bacterium]|nr:PIN domain nuclease [Nitrospirota bacterium]
MILVDTSVLIDYFKGAENTQTKKFHQVLESNIPFGISCLVYMEVLQGSQSDKDLRLLKQYLDTQSFYELKNGRESYAEAARMYLELRKKGVTVKSTVDCLIARVALENELFLLHNDADFDRIAKHFPLKIWNVEV